MLLPTMHQSSLGTLMLLAGPRLASALEHAAAAAAVPDLLRRDGLRRRRVRVGLSSVAFNRTAGDADARPALPRRSCRCSVAFVGLRLGDLVVRGQLGLAFVTGDGRSLAVWLEIALFAGAGLILLIGAGARAISATCSAPRCS